MPVDKSRFIAATKILCFIFGKLIGVKGRFLRQGRICNLCDLTLRMSGAVIMEVIMEVSLKQTSSTLLNVLNP